MQGLSVIDECKKSNNNSFKRLVEEYDVGNAEEAYCIEMESRVATESFVDQLNKPGTYLSKSRDQLESIDYRNDHCFQHGFECPYDLTKELLPQIPSMADTPFFWVDEPSKLKDALASLNKELDACPLLAVDLEYCDTKTSDSAESWGTIAIIQASTTKSDYIFDCFHLRDEIRADDAEGSLRSAFANPKITKIMHGSDTDIKYLVADLGIPTLNHFDTARAFSLIQRIPSIEQIQKAGRIELTAKHVNLQSLEKLSRLILDFQMDKFFQEGDWRLRPLPAGMLDYARGDSHYLIAIYVTLLKLMDPFVFSNNQMESSSKPSNFFDCQLYVSRALRSKDVIVNDNDWLANIASINEYIKENGEQAEAVVKRNDILCLFAEQQREWSMQKQFTKNTHPTLDIKIVEGR